MNKDLRMKRFHGRYEITSSGCWQWIGGKDRHGYGRLKIDGKETLAHRFSYKEFNGDLVPGLVIDHLCSNRACVNPKHLEQVTTAENNRRAPHCSTCSCKHN